MIQIQTGSCEKCDRALERILSMMDRFATFDAFAAHFHTQIKTGDKDTLILWLLRALYALSRQKTLGPAARFEELLDLIDDEGRATMLAWLDEQIARKKETR